MRPWQINYPAAPCSTPLSCADYSFSIICRNDFNSRSCQWHFLWKTVNLGVQSSRCTVQSNLKGNTLIYTESDIAGALASSATWNCVDVSARPTASYTLQIWVTDTFLKGTQSALTVFPSIFTCTVLCHKKRQISFVTWKVLPPPFSQCSLKWQAFQQQILLYYGSIHSRQHCGKHTSQTSI